MIPNHRHLQSGFTLVETTIATAILAYVLVNFIGSFSNLVHSQIRSRLMLQAADYAREGLEVIYNINANTLNSPLGIPGQWANQIYNKVNSGTYRPEYNQITKEVLLVPGTDIPATFFERSLTFHPVCRYASDGELTDDPSCVIDQNVVKVVSKVTINHATNTSDIEISSFVINPESI